MNMFRKYAIPFCIYAILLIVIPIVFIIIYSFTMGRSLDLSTFTINNLTKSTDPLYLEIVLRSISLSLQTTVITLGIGYLVAFFITKIKGKMQNIILVLFIVPMWLNVLLRTYAWKSILSYNGILNQFLDIFSIEPLELLNTEVAVMIGMVYNFLPFMIFPIYTSLITIDEGLINAAKDLGCNSKQVFRRVTLPLSIPGVITGIIFVFMPSATTFIIPLYLGGGKVDTIGNVIERQYTVVGNWNFGSMLSLMVLFLMLVTTYLLRRVGSKYEK